MIVAKWRILFTSAALILSFVAGFLARPAIGSVTITTDGVWWDTISSDARPDVVAGMLDAYEAGFKEGHFYGVVNDGLEVQELDVKIAHKFNTWALNSDMPSVLSTPQFPQEFGTYADEITKFYKEHPGLKSSVTVGEIVNCESKFSLHISCDEMAKEKE